MKIEAKKLDFMIRCSHCPKEFKYNSEKTRHELSHFLHFECETCGKKFSFISALRRHTKQHERTGSVKCDECDRKFRDEVLLRRHIKYAHKGIFTCTKCSSTFSSETALRTHTKVHKPASERRFKCRHENCNKSFNFSHHLKHHELTHTNAKQHYCSVCGKGFIQAHHLKTHLKTHDPAEQLHCELPGCKKKFSTEYARKRHMATHRNRPDSGISSDSNSYEIINSIKTDDYNVCPSCGDNISTDSSHLKTCIGMNNLNLEDIMKTYVKHETQVNEVINELKPSITEIEDCKIAIGGCIANDSNCICEEIAKKENSKTVYVNKDTKVNDRDKADNKTMAIKLNIEIDFNDNYKVTACDGCACASTCKESDKIKCSKRYEPNIKIRNGVVRIDSCDSDIIQIEENMVSLSCKDAIGNCLVGGDDCLCARMVVDEQQAMAQEIEDITPRPKTE